jgi:hypothetical protein
MSGITARRRAILDELFDQPAFELAPARKRELLLEGLVDLTDHHRRHCPEYAAILNGIGYAGHPASLSELPYLPIALFKSLDLRSVPEKDVFKTLTSSGTTGSTPSRVHLDRATATLQSRALTSIMAPVIGTERLPMLIIDSPDTVKGGAFSARSAGILGMMPFGRRHAYALNPDLSVNVEAVKQFARDFGNTRTLLFGFTFMVWRHFAQALDREGISIDFPGGVLIHSGGWKKLAEEAVTNETFRATLTEQFGLAHIRNFYGMAEQVGSVFLEGADGLLHAPNFADVIVRNPRTWLPQPTGEVGVIEVLSVIPESYPGHILLTEDLGVIRRADDPAAAWRGPGFEVLGRVPRTELRGCSDTHAASLDLIARAAS